MPHCTTSAVCTKQSASSNNATSPFLLEYFCKQILFSLCLFFRGFYSSNVIKRRQCLILGLGKLSEIIPPGQTIYIHISFPWPDTEISDFRSLTVLHRARILLFGLFSAVTFWMFQGPSLQASSSQTHNSSSDRHSKRQRYCSLWISTIFGKSHCFHHTKLMFFSLRG